jgi:hypothetical protein
MEWQAEAGEEVVNSPQCLLDDADVECHPGNRPQSKQPSWHSESIVLHILLIWIGLAAIEDQFACVEPTFTRPPKQKMGRNAERT